MNNLCKRVFSITIMTNSFTEELTVSKLLVESFIHVDVEIFHLIDQIPVLVKLSGICIETISFLLMGLLTQSRLMVMVVMFARHGGLDIDGQQ